MSYYIMLRPSAWFYNSADRQTDRQRERERERERERQIYR